MKRITKIAVAAGAALALVLAAAAVSAGPYGPGPGRNMGGYGAGPGYYGMGPGMMSGYGRGMMGGYGTGPRGGYDENRQQPSPGLESKSGRLFAQTCSQCHALPDPQQHTAAQWPSVVARMEQHMRQSNIPLPGEREIKDIDAFLEQHANGRG